MDFLQNQFIQVVATLAALLCAPLVIMQIVRELLVPAATGIGKTRRQSKAHLNNVTDLSRDNSVYMSACVLILIVRILASFFCVTASILMVISALFLHLSGATSSVFDVISITLLVLTSIFLLGTLASAKKFSDTVRRKIAPESMERRPLF